MSQGGQAQVGACGRKPGPEERVHDKLDQKVDEAGQRLADRGGQPREIDLAEHLAVRHKSIGRIVDAGGEKGPDCVARHVKQKRRRAIGRKAGQPAEDNVEQDCCDQRVQHNPRRAEDRLFVEHREVAFDKHHNEVTVLPQFAEVDIEPAGARLDDGGQPSSLEVRAAGVWSAINSSFAVS